MLPSIVPFDFGEESVSSGIVVQVVCTVKDGDLPIKIDWFLNEQEISNVPDISVTPAGRRGSLLTVESVQYHHAGNFTCKAENIAGKTEYSTPLQVNG